MYRSLLALIDRVGDAAIGTSDADGQADATPDALLRAVQDGTCFLFAGEGVSRTSATPGWPEYLHQLIQYLAHSRLIDAAQADVLRHAWQSRRYDRVEAIVRTSVPAGDSVARSLARQLYKQNLTPLTSRTLHLLGSIPFCAAVTPNLDPLVETVLGFETLTPQDGVLVQDRLAESLPFILKLRGRADDESLMLWPDEATSQLSAPCTEAIRDLLHTRTMLAVGISVDELNRWLASVGVSRPDGCHYLVGSGPDREWKRKADALYRKFHVRAVAPHTTDSPEALSFLNPLVRQHRDV